MYKTASGSLVPDGGPLGFQGYDEQSSQGTKVLASAGEMAVREGNGFYLGSGGGYVISAQSPVGKVVPTYGSTRLLPLCFEDQVYN